VRCTVLSIRLMFKSAHFFMSGKTITINILWFSSFLHGVRECMFSLVSSLPSVMRTYQNVFFFISVCISYTSSSTWAGFLCGGSLSSPSWVGTGTIRKPISFSNQSDFVIARRIYPSTAKEYLVTVLAQQKGEGFTASVKA
jgi:hypothetical protein